MIDTSLPLRLMLERKRLGLSQEAMATRAGVERETWSRYENGHMQPGTDIWIALAALGADVNYILSGLGARQDAARYSDSKPLSPRKAKLLDNYENLPEESQRDVERVIATMAQSLKVKSTRKGSK